MGRADVFGLGDGRPRLRRGLRVTHLGDERLVLDPASGVVHTVRGPAVAELDRVLAGRSGIDSEVFTALVASGIVESPGVSRRTALKLSSSGLALVASATLPSALAAASTGSYQVTGSGQSGELELFTASSNGTNYDLYRLAHVSSASAAIERTFTISTVARRVQVLLVGAGGGGGIPDSTPVAPNNTYDTVFGGGGGGGEVVEIDLGLVPAGTSLTVSVAGAPGLGVSGGDSELREGATVLVTALGGGAGGSESSSGQNGGSGGGGASPASYRTAGEAPVRSSIQIDGYPGSDVDYFGNNGGGGVTGSGGGGGGAGEAGDPGSGTIGGDGGSGRDISGFFLNANVGSSATRVAGGGGGAGSSGGGGEDGGGLSAHNFGGLRFATGGALGTGGGGGGGASYDRNSLGPGDGGTGLAWIRIQTN